jgi:hypothetical protein
VIYELPTGKTMTDHDLAIKAAVELCRKDKLPMVSLLEHESRDLSCAAREIVVRADGTVTG